MTQFVPPLPQPPPFLPNVALLYRREGQFLVVRDGAMLPPRCVVTNEAINEQDWTKRRVLTWTPGWVYVGLLGGLLPLLILILCTQKKTNLTYSLSREVRNKIHARMAIAWSIFLVGLAAALSAAVFDAYAAMLILSGIVVILVGLVCVILFQSQVKIARQFNGEYWIKGCGLAFLDSIG